MKNIPVAVPVAPVKLLADLLWYLLLLLAAEINWLDTLPMEHHNTEAAPQQDLKSENMIIPSTVKIIVSTVRSIPH